jgi:hypothetical protein
MVAVTYDVARVPAAAPAAQSARAEKAVPRKSWLARLMDAVIEARMQQVRRELRMYNHLLPYSLDERADRLVKAKSGDMPFGNW